MKNPKVCIVTVTYNHENYLRQALDSFLCQKTNFPFEVIVADDYSNDSTRTIIKEYVSKYPSIIKPLFQPNNTGGVKNFIDALKLASKAEYIATCDGDDFWTDNKKLQKQVDFLNKNPDYSICFHQVNMFYENNSRKSEIIPRHLGKNPQSYKKLLYENYIQSSSVLYRTAAIKPLIDNYPQNIYPCDWLNYIFCGINGKIGFINKVMSAYRKNTGGISYSTSSTPQYDIFKRYGIKILNAYKFFLKNVHNNYPEYYKEKFLPDLNNAILVYLKNASSDNLNFIKENYQKELQDLIELNFKEYTYKYKWKYLKYKKANTTLVIFSSFIFTLLIIELILFQIKSLH